MKHTRSEFLAILAAGMTLASSWALAAEVPKAKATRSGLYLSSADAGQMLADRSVLLVDIRSRAEVSFLGLPERADIHIPYMELPLAPEYDREAKTYKLEINPDFPLAFRAFMQQRGLSADTRIVLMCRSGHRSARAADLLFEMGYRNVYSLVDGFEGDKVKDGPSRGKRLANGWKNAGLAWSYTIEPDQVYPEDR